MKRFVAMSAVILCVFATIAFADDSAEKAAIKKTLEDHYFAGLANNDPDLLGKVFHTSSSLQAVSGDGKVWAKPSVEWRKGFDPTKKATKYECVVADIRLAGNVASVTTVLESDKVKYIDYLNMMKIEGKWMIVSKIFHTIRK